MRIPIVNEQDEIIGHKERSERDPGDISRATGLWVTDKDGNILLAQRSLKKKNGPGMWGPAVAGTVEEGETYESNMIKEAKEEIGLQGIRFKLGPKIRRSGTHEYFAQWFTVVVDRNYPFVKQDEEVEALKWFSVDELDAFLKQEKLDIFLASVKNYKNIFLNYENQN